MAVVKEIEVPGHLLQIERSNSGLYSSWSYRWVTPEEDYYLGKGFWEGPDWGSGLFETVAETEAAARAEVPWLKRLNDKNL